MMAVIFCGRGTPMFLSSEPPIHLDVKCHAHINVVLSRPIFSFLISSGVMPSTLSNAIQAFAIYFAIHLVQNSFPDFLSILYTSFIILGNLIPNLCGVHQYLDFTLEIIIYRWCNFSLKH